MNNSDNHFWDILSVVITLIIILYYVLCIITTDSFNDYDDTEYIEINSDRIIENKIVT